MPAKEKDSSVKTLVILLNMGGPQNKDDIHPYLKELFQDRELLKLPFQKILGRIIAWRRTPKIQERYEEIGQYSPTKKIMDEQCIEISKKLDLNRPESAPHVCVSGFRYCSPRPGEMIKKYKDAERIILFSQYPQHSCATSGSSLCDAYRWLDKQSGEEYQNKISVIDQWWDRNDYSELWAMLIKRKFDEMKASHNLNDEDIRIIYSAHSLPESYCLEKGDKYNQEIQNSMNRIEDVLKSKGLQHEGALAWQSKVGPQRTKWLTPSTPTVIAETKQKAILMVPIAFTTDHIETLDEIDIEFRGYADEVVDHFERVDCFNMEEKFIELCSKLVSEHIDRSYDSCIRPCCVNCEGNDCAAMRKYFNSHPISQNDEDYIASQTDSR
ncbi:MAG: ferrochelatase [Opitutae bacterium]|nr:ferrochelatase [Opitutae bacterium]